MEALFEVGQRVIALCDQAQGHFKKGEIYTVLDIKQVCCHMCIQISTKTFENMALVCSCGSEIDSDVSFFNQKEFAPIQEKGDMTFEEAISLVTQKELV